VVVLGFALLFCETEGFLALFDVDLSCDEPQQLFVAFVTVVDTVDDSAMEMAGRVAKIAAAALAINMPFDLLFFMFPQ
jgi:hypothetical protein